MLADLPERADVLVIGSRGYRFMRRLLLGGVAGALVRNARYPVVFVPAGDGRLAHRAPRCARSALRAGAVSDSLASSLTAAPSLRSVGASRGRCVVIRRKLAHASLAALVGASRGRCR